MQHLTTKYFKATKNRIAFFRVFVDRVYIGQIWEALPILAPLKYCAYQLYEVMQFIHPSNEDVYKRGVAIAEKILRLNNQGESAEECDATDAQL